VRTYALESLVFRTAGLIDRQIGALPHDPTDGSAALAALEEYAVEASIAKVAGSETLNFVLDENIQIHGGNGYVRDYPAERHFRDARVNRIFEGTNEINRLLIPGMLARRAVKGELPIIPAATSLKDELLGPPAFVAAGSGPLSDEERTVTSLKKTALMVFGLAMQTFGARMTDEQEVLMQLADLLIDVYSAESALLRARAASSNESPQAALHVAAARVFVSDAAMRVEANARQALAAIGEGDELRTALAALRRLLRATPVNTVALRRTIADEAGRRRGYPFDVW
jgi:alkylation response protein AidB-like acyl-CoA dehydrogenase